MAGAVAHRALWFQGSRFCLRVRDNTSIPTRLQVGSERGIIAVHSSKNGGEAFSQMPFLRAGRGSHMPSEKKRPRRTTADVRSTALDVLYAGDTTRYRQQKLHSCTLLYHTPKLRCLYRRGARNLSRDRLLFGARRHANTQQHR